MKMSMLAIFAIVPVMGLVGLPAVTIMPVPVDAEAAGCNNR
jgi:predicted lipoprotein